MGLYRIFRLSRSSGGSGGQCPRSSVLGSYGKMGVFTRNRRTTTMTETRRLAKASIVSGYFSPPHQGHLDVFEAARARSGYLIVIVNNDQQQILKKGRVIQAAEHRL